MSTESKSSESTQEEKVNIDETSPESKNEFLSINNLPKRLGDSQIDIEHSLKNFRKINSKPKAHHYCMNIFKAVFIRALFIAQSIFFMIYIMCHANRLEFVALCAPLLVIIIDGIYVCLKRQGFFLK